MPDPAAAAVPMAQALLDGIARPMLVEGHEIHLRPAAWLLQRLPTATAPTPCCAAPTPRCTRPSWGRNQASVYAAAPHDDDPEAGAETTATRCATSSSTLHYQPQVDLGHGRIVGVEALLRWQHPTPGRIAPDRFILIAEETGLILAIGDWVLRRAIEQAAAWRSVRLPLLRMVNLSALMQPDLAARIEGLPLPTASIRAVRCRGHREHADRQLRAGRAHPAGAACARRRGPC